jgi:hypothetical protein
MGDTKEPTVHLSTSVRFGYLADGDQPLARSVVQPGSQIYSAFYSSRGRARQRDARRIFHDGPKHRRIWEISRDRGSRNPPCSVFGDHEVGAGHESRAHRRVGYTDRLATWLRMIAGPAWRTKPRLPCNEGFLIWTSGISAYKRVPTSTERLWGVPTAEGQRVGGITCWRHHTRWQALGNWKRPRAQRMTEGSPVSPATQSGRPTYVAEHTFP